MANPPIVELRNVRLRKLEQLRELGFDPFPSRSLRSHYSQSILDDFENLQGTPVVVAGRLMSLRAHGALTFAHIQDQTGRIQLYIRRDDMLQFDPRTANLGYEHIDLLDVGDFVEAEGIVTATKKGERSVGVRTLRILTKSLRPLPEKRAGVRDRETILRRRYLDTTTAPERKAPFEKVSRMLFAIREFLSARGFYEFHTPVLQPQYGGGTAKPFTTHLNALRIDVYLAISHELYLKRLIAAGFDHVFTIGRYFRNEGIDSTHHPEFSMVETMSAYQNYEFNMDLVEALFRHVAESVFGRTVFSVGSHVVDFAPQWQRVAMVDAVRAATGIDFSGDMSLRDAQYALSSIGVDADVPSVGHALVNVFEAKVQPTLIQPTLVYGHPVEISPLAKAMAADRRFAERFEIFIAGIECGDNWSEQNDPIALHERWVTFQRTREGERQPIDYDFLEVLEHGMPPTTGIGPGIERMAMIFNETQNIDDVIFFPLMRPAVSDANAAIYEASMEPVRNRGEIALTIEAFEQLIEDGALSPESSEATLELSLELWNKRDAAGRWRATGAIRVVGLLSGRDVILTNYMVTSEEPLGAEAEAKRFADHTQLFVDETLKLRWPSTRFTVVAPSVY